MIRLIAAFLALCLAASAHGQTPPYMGSAWVGIASALGSALTIWEWE
jgi:hypothetical protein